MAVYDRDTAGTNREIGKLYDRDTAGTNRLIYNSEFLLLPSSYSWSGTGSGGATGSGYVSGSNMILRGAYNGGYKLICNTAINFSQFSKMTLKYNVTKTSNSTHFFYFQSSNKDAWNTGNNLWTQQNLSVGNNKVATINLSNINSSFKPIFGVHCFIYDSGPLEITITNIKLE